MFKDSIPPFVGAVLGKMLAGMITSDTGAAPIRSGIGSERQEP